jgi:hypothetical protein
MEDIKIVSGNTEQQVWAGVASTLQEDIFDYNLLIKQGKKQIKLHIGIDVGGGFEASSALTQLSAILSHKNTFKFAIHDKSFIDQVGKFFGMQDVEIGYPSLDKHLIIKTDNKEKVRHVFADADIQSVFSTLESFDCGIYADTDENGKQHAYLELNIDEGINKPAQLRKIYHAFYKLLMNIEHQLKA